MAVRAEEPKVVGAVVEPVTIDVINVERGRDQLWIETAVLASVRTADRDERSPEHRRLLSQATFRALDEDLVGRAPTDTRLAATVCLTREVRRVDTEVSDPFRDMGLRTASLSQAQATEHSGKLVEVATAAASSSVLYRRFDVMFEASEVPPTALQRKQCC